VAQGPTPRDFLMSGHVSNHVGIGLVGSSGSVSDPDDPHDLVRTKVLYKTGTSAVR
jgi:hypothetical protein